MNPQLWWYIARAGGLLAWALLAASVLWGVALASRIFGRRPRPAWLLDLHRYLGGLAVIFIGVHVAAIMLDSYVHFGPAETFVPFAGSWHPNAVAWGIVAMYLVLAVELTSLARTHLPLRIWRRVHYLSFAVFVLATIHGLSAGTDSNTPALLIPTIAVCAAVVILIVFRVWPRQAKPVTTRASNEPDERAGGAVRRDPGSPASWAPGTDGREAPVSRPRSPVSSVLRQAPSPSPGRARGTRSRRAAVTARAGASVPPGPSPPPRAGRREHERQH